MNEMSEVIKFIFDRAPCAPTQMKELNQPEPEPEWHQDARDIEAGKTFPGTFPKIVTEKLPYLPHLVETVCQKHYYGIGTCACKRG